MQIGASKARCGRTAPYPYVYIPYREVAVRKRNQKALSVDLDLFDTPAATIAALQQRDIKVVCYFSAGTYEDWRPDKDSFTSDMYGKALPDWKGEYYVDTRNVRAIMTTRLQLAKEKGCDGVDPDIDAWDAASGFPLTQVTQLDYNKFLAASAHALNLSVGLKNDIAQAAQLVECFDFAVNEECIQLGSCGDVQVFVAQNKSVFGIEYKGDRTAGCDKSLELKGERFSCRNGNAATNGTSSAVRAGASLASPTAPSSPASALYSKLSALLAVGASTVVLAGASSSGAMHCLW